jgi:uncharacterized protein YpmB
MWVWLVSTTIMVLVVYLSVMLMYYRSQIEKEQSKNLAIRVTLEEAEILLRKYQIQLQRSLGNADVLTEEMSESKEKLKQLNSRYLQIRNDNDDKKRKIVELEAKIEAII